MQTDSSAAIDVQAIFCEITDIISFVLAVHSDQNHGVAFSRLTHDLLHHVMGPGRRRGSVFSAQRTKQGSDCHQSDPHGHLLLFILVDSDSVSGQSSVRPSAQE